MKIMANQILASVYPVKASTCFTCAEFELATKGLVERWLGMSVIRGRSVVTRYRDRVSGAICGFIYLQVFALFLR